MEKSTYNPRQLLTLAVFGGFWGVTESTLGTFLHLLHVPVSGLILGLAGLFIVLNAVRFTPVRGGVILMGLVAALVKAAAISSVKLGPMIGIMSEALIIEVTTMALGFSIISFMTAGFLVSTVPMVMAVIMKTIYFGTSLIEFTIDFFHSYPLAWLLLIGTILLHWSMGVAAGWLTWRVSEDIRKRRKPGEA